MTRPRSHRLKGARHRGLYALIWAKNHDPFVRLFWFGDGDYLIIGLDNEVLS